VEVSGRVIAVLASSVAGVAASACGSTTRPLSPAGTWSTTAQPDEGAGQLAQQSARLSLGGDLGPAFADRRRAEPRAIDMANGDSTYGGETYGGQSYATWSPPQITYTTPIRQPGYSQRTGLVGVIEGVVRWTGAPPQRVATACGTIDNPTLRVGEGKALRGALVYIAKVSVGRATAYYGKPATVGGIVVKRGCALVPAAQVVAPIPSTLTIYGDAARAKLRVDDTAYELQQGGMIALDVQSGVTEIVAEDGRIAPAWLVAIDSPYYAITDDAGRFRIDELASGTYDVTIWQPAPTTARADGTLSVGAPIVVHRSVHVDGTHPARLDVALR
jgi:hypothetical protein